MSEIKKNTEEPVVGGERDVLPLGKLFVWAGALGAVLLILLISLWHFYRTQSTAEVTRKQLLRPAPLLVEARTKDRAALASYAQVDAKKGLYRIPVAQAIELMLSNPRLLLSTPLPKKPKPKPKPKPSANAAPSDGGEAAAATPPGDGAAAAPSHGDGGLESARDAGAPPAKAAVPAKKGITVK